MPDISGQDFAPYAFHEYPKWVDGVLVESAPETDQPEAAAEAPEPVIEPETPATEAEAQAAPEAVPEAAAAPEEAPKK